MHRPGRLRRGERPREFQGHSVRFYDFLARMPMRSIYRRLAGDIAGTAPRDGAVLDVGTGPGVLLVELARRRPDLRLTGVDLSPDMVAAAERNARPFGDRITVRVADVADLPFPDGSFDLVVSSLSLHHWDQPEAAVAQLARVLRPGGQLCIYDFPFAPFDTMSTTARTTGPFAGQAPRQTIVRIGPWPFPRCVKYQLAAAPA